AGGDTRGVPANRVRAPHSPSGEDAAELSKHRAGGEGHGPQKAAGGPELALGGAHGTEPASVPSCLTRQSPVLAARPIRSPRVNPGSGQASNPWGEGCESSVSPRMTMGTPSGPHGATPSSRRWRNPPTAPEHQGLFAASSIFLRRLSGRMSVQASLI